MTNTTPTTQQLSEINTSNAMRVDAPVGFSQFGSVEMASLRFLNKCRDRRPAEMAHKNGIKEV